MGRRLRAYASMAVALGLLCAGCEPFDHLEICVVEGEPGSSVSTQSVRLVQGTAVAIKFIPYNPKGKQMGASTDMIVEAQDHSILGVDKLIERPWEASSCPGDPDVDRYYVLWGIEAGTTELIVRVGYDDVVSVPVEVLPP